MSGALSSSVGPYPSEAPTGYWGHVGGHGADIPPFLGQGSGALGVNNFGFGSTQGVIGSSIPPYAASAIPGGLPPIGGPPLGPPLVPGYYPGGAGGIGGGGLDGNRPYNIRCDEGEGFKQVRSELSSWKFKSKTVFVDVIWDRLRHSDV